MLRLVKRNGRLMILDPEGAVVYSPPDFLLPLGSRRGLEVLVERMNAPGAVRIDEVRTFESRAARRGMKRRGMS